MCYPLARAHAYHPWIKWYGVVHLEEDQNKHNMGNRRNIPGRTRHIWSPLIRHGSLRTRWELESCVSTTDAHTGINPRVHWESSTCSVSSIPTEKRKTNMCLSGRIIKSTTFAVIGLAISSTMKRRHWKRSPHHVLRAFFFFLQ
jgi:hypothetical protein